MLENDHLHREIIAEVTGLIWQVANLTKFTPPESKQTIAFCVFEFLALLLSLKHSYLYFF